MKTEEDHQGTTVTLHLAAAGSNIDLASSLLAHNLGIPLAEATARLRAPPGPLAALPRPQADRLRSVLASVGVRLDPDPDARPAVSCTLSLQPRVWADPRHLAQRITAILGGCEEDHLQALLGPGGLILPPAGAETCRVLERRLGRIRGLVLLRDDAAQPMADLFPRRDLSAKEARRLAALRRGLGLQGDTVTGAVLSNLPAGLARRLLQDALRDLDLIAVRRIFQRFDLYLTGQAGWMVKDLADFLVARTGQSRGRFESLSPADPVRLDLDLTPATARRFVADYAAIGLFTRPVLRGLLRNLENPIP